MTTPNTQTEADRDLSHAFPAEHVRDGSTDDIIACWIAQIIDKAERSRLPILRSEIYAALLRQATRGLVAEAQGRASGCFAPAEIRKFLVDLQTDLEAVAPRTTGDQPDTMPPELPRGPWVLLSRTLPRYWQDDSWKKDFFASLSDEFWLRRGYAFGAGKGKMEFLRELAEVWIAAAASALVHYAHDDRRVWQETAEMLHSIADKVAKDGLRTLPWGEWRM